MKDKTKMGVWGGIIILILVSFSLTVAFVPGVKNIFLNKDANKNYKVVVDEPNYGQCGKGYRIVDSNGKTVLAASNGDNNNLPNILKIYKDGDDYYFEETTSYSQCGTGKAIIYNEKGSKILSVNNEFFSFVNGKIYVADNNKINEYNKEGKLLSENTKYKEVYGITNNYAVVINKDNYLEMVDLKSNSTYVYKTIKTYDKDTYCDLYVLPKIDGDDIVLSANNHSEYVNFNIDTKLFSVNKSN